MPELTATCVWAATVEVVLALDGNFGEPTDAYVNGSQTWLRDDGPAGATLFWRLLPVARFARPKNIDVYELFSTVSLALACGQVPPAPLTELWDGLEVFAADAISVEPAPLADAAARSLGIPPAANGLVDHTPIDDAWYRTRGEISIFEALMSQLSARADRG
jgi:hypothetical protein